MKLIIIAVIVLLSNCRLGIYGTWRIIDVSFDKSLNTSPLENSVVREKVLQEIYGSYIKIQQDSIIMIVQGNEIYRSSIDKITARTIEVTESGKTEILMYSRLNGQSRYLFEQPDGTKLIVEKE